MIRQFTRTVGGKEVVVELDTSTLDPSSDLDAEAGSIASQVGLVAEMMAVATERLESADSGYRHWRAIRVSQSLSSDPKLAEWKVKARVEADPGFMTHKNKIAALTGDVEFLRVYLSGLKTKASMVRGRIELTRSEWEGTSLGLDIKPEDAAKAAETLTRSERVRSAMKRRKSEE